jgi:hypothetical protein
MSALQQQDRGELGELGENPAMARVTEGREKGESGRILGELTYKSPKYPVEALGKLKDVCCFMSEEGQIDVAMCGQTLLTAAALMTQGMYDVETLAGRKPLCLYALTLAGSGERKSTAETIALKKINDFDKAQHERYQSDVATNQEKPAKERDTTKQGYLLCRDATTQGIVQSFSTGSPSQGVFTSEGAVMLCGWGMKAEQKLNTAGNLNAFWDGGTISVVRGTGGRVQLYNKRLSAHWLIQPDVIEQVLQDDELSRIGLWPRFLVAWPEALKPTPYKPFQFWDKPVVQGYWQRCGDILKDFDPTEEERELSQISIDSDARELLIHFYNKMEYARDESNELNGIKPFAVRSAEMVCRVAGVLAAFEKHGRKVVAIDKDIMENAIKLVSYSLNTWLGIFGLREQAQHEKWAEQLYNWMKKRNNRMASERDILRFANPTELRKAFRRDIALGILRDCNLITEATKRDDNGRTIVLPKTWIAL